MQNVKLLFVILSLPKNPLMKQATAIVQGDVSTALSLRSTRHKNRHSSRGWELRVARSSMIQIKCKIQNEIYDKIKN